MVASLGVVIGVVIGIVIGPPQVALFTGEQVAIATHPVIVLSRQLHIGNSAPIQAPQLVELLHRLLKAPLLLLLPVRVRRELPPGMLLLQPLLFGAVAVLPPRMLLGL